MDNRQFEAAAGGAPPSPPASPSSGYPTNGNPATATPATKPGEYWFHQIGEELRNVIIAGGLTPNNTALTQVRDAIQQIINTGGIKLPVRAATTAAINLAAPGAAIDDVTMAVGDRFLDKDNGTAANRGIYIWNGAAVPATRATDADGVGELFAGMLVTVSEGTVNAGSIWMLTTPNPITIGTTGLTFELKDAPVASTADAQAFTDNTKIITALRLKEALQGSNQSLGPSGYQKLPGGLIIQWGYVTCSASGPVNWTYPLTFPNQVLCVGPLGVKATSAQFASIGDTDLVKVPVSAWNFDGSRTPNGVLMLAIGY